MADDRVPTKRARSARLEEARERRRNLDPDLIARERRIDEATVDVGIAWEQRWQALLATAEAEAAAAEAIERLVKESLPQADVVRLTGLDSSTLRRLRKIDRGTDGDPT
jgi:hypothetical protein